MKLIFLGDSLTWGAYGGNFVDAAAAGLTGYSLVNAGAGGNTVLNLLRRLDDALAESPDGIFVMVGGNDAISFCQPETRPYYRQAQALPEGFVSPEEFARAYRDLLTRIQLAYVQVWIGLPSAEYNPTVVETLRQYDALAAEAARSLNIPVFDLMAHFPPGDPPPRPALNLGTINLIGQRIGAGWSDFEAERRKHGYTFTFDGLHFMPDSARRLGELIAGFLKS